eukprot:6193755-Pleurochrysis_carterae.AAC.1
MTVNSSWLKPKFGRSVTEANCVKCGNSMGSSDDLRTGKRATKYMDCWIAVNSVWTGVRNFGKCVNSCASGCNSTA